MRVLIFGAGIAGLGLVLRLRQRGLAPVAVERPPRLRDGGYMLGLSDPGLDAAERMGVADALRAARHMPRRLVYVDGHARERFALGGAALDWLVGERRFNLLRGDIERALYERVRGEVEVHRVLHGDNRGIRWHAPPRRRCGRGPFTYHAPMENEHVLGGLLRKRAEVAGELEEAQSRVRRLMADIDAVDATIRLLSATVDLAEIRPKALPRRHTAYHGEIQRAIYAAFRETAGTLTTHDVTVRVMASRGLNVSDALLVRTMQKRVGAALRQMREKGRVEAERLPAGRAGWRSIAGIP